MPEPQSQLGVATKATSPNKVSVSLSQASLEWVQRELTIGTTARSSYEERIIVFPILTPWKQGLMIWVL